MMRVQSTTIQEHTINLVLRVRTPPPTDSSIFKVTKSIEQEIDYSGISELFNTDKIPQKNIRSPLLSPENFSFFSSPSLLIPYLSHPYHFMGKSTLFRQIIGLEGFSSSTVTIPTMSTVKPHFLIQ